MISMRQIDDLAERMYDAVIDGCINQACPEVHLRWAQLQERHKRDYLICARTALLIAMTHTEPLLDWRST